MIGLICATEYESNEIVRDFGLEELEGTKNLKVYGNNDIILIVSGIGKIMSTIAIAYLTKIFDCKYLINIGVVGSCKQDLKVGDILFPTQVMQYDVELPFRNKHTSVIYEPLEVNQVLSLGEDYNVICATGDKALNSNKKGELGRKFDVDILDMELFSITRYIYEMGDIKRFIAIKGVSDTLDGDYKLDNLKETMKILSAKLDEIIKNLQ